MRHMPKKHWLLVGGSNQILRIKWIQGIETESAKCPETGTRQARQARLAHARGPCIVLSIDTTTCTMSDGQKYYDFHPQIANEMS
jgi:hypothetical protein